MHSVRLFFYLLSAVCLVFMVIGLFKPWLLLWWEDVQNRKKIIRIYGLLALVFYLAYKTMGWF